MHGLEYPFVFPNELTVIWTLMIVLYPYITGLVAGAFIVSSLYHVFGNKDLAPVSKLSLICAFAFLLFATLPLLLHLGHPERAFNIMFTPNLTSAMSGFGFIYAFYAVLVAIEVWLIFRSHIIRMSTEASSKWLRLFYTLLTLGVKNISEKSLAIDHKITHILAIIGIPAACLLHGYVGFIFGSLKSNAWWSSPLMPVIFLLSAIVSGIAALTIVYLLSCVWRGVQISAACVRTLCTYLWGFLILDVVLELLEILQLFYEGSEEWIAVWNLITHKLFWTFVVGQVLVGAFIPLILLGIVASVPRMTERFLYPIASVSGILILFQVLLMRWNVVIGGQLLGKAYRGLVSIHLEWLGREGILMAIGILGAMCLTLFVLVKLLPPWQEQEVVE